MATPLVIAIVVVMVAIILVLVLVYLRRKRLKVDRTGKRCAKKIHILISLSLNVSKSIYCVRLNANQEPRGLLRKPNFELSSLPSVISVPVCNDTCKFQHFCEDTEMASP